MARSGGTWTKGRPKTGGRPKGSPNKATREIREFARRVLEQPQYQEKVLRMFRRLPAAEIPGHFVTLLHHYAYGRPREQIEVSGPGGVPLEGLVKVYLSDNARRRKVAGNGEGGT